jgi:hypothetical protein
MSSSTKLPKIIQVGLIVICVGLAVSYLAEPTRFQVPSYPIDSWVNHLAHTLGSQAADADALLTPSDTIAAGAQPQFELGGSQFLGCDHALQGGQLYLVTNWRLAATTDRPVLRFQFLSPNQAVQEVTQTLDQSQLFTPLPAEFYSGDRVGTILLRDEGTDDVSWIRICQ